MYVKYYIQNSYFLIIMIELETNKKEIFARHKNLLK